MRSLRLITTVVVLASLAAGVALFIYSGLYNIGADVHHTKPVFAVVQMRGEENGSHRHDVTRISIEPESRSPGETTNVRYKG